MLKKIAALAVVINMISVGFVQAVEVETNITGIQFTVVERTESVSTVTMKEFFTQYCNTVGYGVPEVFRQIPLRIPGVDREDVLYAALQKCVYLGFVPNSTVTYQWSNPITTRFVNLFVHKTLKFDPNVSEKSDLLSREVFVALMDSLPNYKMLDALAGVSRWGSSTNYQSQLIRAQGFDVLTQVYQMLKSDYRTGNSVSDETLINGAIKGMSEAIGDIHTQYFPPVEAQQFNDSLNGSFEGIGGYLDMLRPGEVIVTSLVKDAPAQKAGIQPNDRIIKVDDYEITDKDSLDGVIARIKGPAGTTVKLTIVRNGAQKEFTVTRAKIVISMIDYQLRNGVPIISIHSFGRGVSSSRQTMIKDNKTAIERAGKIIIDLRNNPGGSLSEVADMLSDFVDKDLPVVVTQSRYEEETVVSSGREIIDFSKIKIVILINSSTASAAEIMAGTIKDYFPRTIIVGETSYGKGSVQYLQPMPDNSSFKMTIAHRYTGKTKKAIEIVGIKPDIEVVLDLNELKQGYDTQLEAAMRQ